MSPKLALSSALSVLLMAGFALSGGTSLQMGEDLAANGPFAPARAELPGAPALPALPFLR